MIARLSSWAALAAGFCLGGQALAAEPAAPNDYGKPESWLCLPGHKGACDRDLSRTVVAADGTLTVKPFEPAKDPSLDCIYLYPTASADPTGNSDMIAGPQEEGAAWAHLGQFGAVCRTFAPLYRSATLVAVMGGAPTTPVDNELAYRDVRDAWNHYLERHNQGRGVVLIGLSQGARLWERLIREEIDGKPVAAKVASVMLLGEPSASRVSETFEPKLSTFRSFPPCTRKDQLGCAVRFSAYRSASPPVAESLFGRGEGICVNPAAPGGGKADLHPIFLSVIRKAEAPWAAGKKVGTPFVELPGLVSAECVQRGDYDYLAVTVRGDPKDPRVDDLAVDFMIGGKVAPAWGLHGAEPMIAMGDLIEIVRAQGAAFANRR